MLQAVRRLSTSATMKQTALQWKRFSIIGHSMGGNVGGLFSAVFPELVDSLVILDSLGFLPTAQEEMAGIVRKGVEELVQFEAERERGRREKVYSYDSALKRLQAANPSLSEESVAVLLERGSTAVEGGVVFNRDYRINLTNIVRITLEQSLDMQARIQARVLLVMAEEGILRLYRQRPQQAEMLQQLIKGYGDKLSEVSVVEVPGDHHVHLNSPETVAPLITAFLNSGTPVTPPSAKL
ncbi:serine hydrolase-like protein isoform X2 [Amia ocellicauda]|uniref:serine hydrolase-like protein isoform X2 n=1 Tax=Amia ocellicauda TaxID=2972642 RepID=UPI0034641CF9